MEHQQFELTADHKFEFMVCIAHEDISPDNYGIFGPLSERQREILLNAGNKEIPNIEVMRAWTIIHSDLGFMVHVYPDSVGDIADHFIPTSQIRRISKRDDWPRYPMMVCSFYMHDF